MSYCYGNCFSFCLPALFIPWDGSWHDRTTVPRLSELYQTWPDERLQTQKVHMMQRGAGQYDWQHNDPYFKQDLMKPTMPSHPFDIGYWAVVYNQYPLLWTSPQTAHQRYTFKTLARLTSA
jgi:hypothetical protein